MHRNFLCWQKHTYISPITLGLGKTNLLALLDVEEKNPELITQNTYFCRE